MQLEAFNKRDRANQDSSSTSKIRKTSLRILKLKPSQLRNGETYDSPNKRYRRYPHLAYIERGTSKPQPRRTDNTVGTIPREKSVLPLPFALSRFLQKYQATLYPIALLPSHALSVIVAPIERIRSGKQNKDDDCTDTCQANAPGKLY